MSKTLFEVTVRDNMSIRTFERIAIDEEEIKRAFKSYDILKIIPRKIVNFKTSLINGGVIRG